MSQTESAPAQNHQEKSLNEHKQEHLTPHHDAAHDKKDDHAHQDASLGKRDTHHGKKSPEKKTNDHSTIEAEKEGPVPTHKLGHNDDHKRDDKKDHAHDKKDHANDKKDHHHDKKDHHHDKKDDHSHDKHHKKDEEHIHKKDGHHEHDHEKKEVIVREETTVVETTVTEEVKDGMIVRTEVVKEEHTVNNHPESQAALAHGEHAKAVEHEKKDDKESENKKDE